MTDEAHALAAVDIGSNSFRLEIGRFEAGRYRRLDYLKEVVRLGAGLDAERRLTEEAAARGLQTLARFASRLEGFEPRQVRAVATQTLREAANRNAFLQRAQDALGHPIEVISGREEGRLIYAGVAQLQPSNAPRLVVDIGGRSTEMILGRGHRPGDVESFQVGSVGLSQRYFADGRLTASAFRAAQIAAGAELEEGLATFRRDRWHEALGASGTVGAVSQVLAAAGVTDGRLTLPALAWCIERCIDAGRVDRIELPGLKDDRRPVIGGGLSVLYTLLAHFGIDELMPARGALRHGLLVELQDRLWGIGERSHDVRDDAVRELQQRFGVDFEHARRVREVALARHAQLAPDAYDESRRELGWVCDLHEAGMIVSHHDHHRHCAYLLARCDAAGFSQGQQRRLAELALGQRGGLRKLEPGLMDETFLWQVLALRLAVIECHARTSIKPRAIAAHRDGRAVTLHLRDGWADEHPRTLYLLREEAQAWSRTGPLVLRLAG